MLVSFQNDIDSLEKFKWIVNNFIILAAKISDTDIDDGKYKSFEPYLWYLWDMSPKISRWFSLIKICHYFLGHGTDVS